MNRSMLIGAVVAAVAFMLFGASFYVVNETEQVIITQFGKPIGEPITRPGPRFRMPFLQKVNRFDRRFLEWDGAANQLPTRDKRFIWVDTYARWRISDPLLFFQRLRDERGAQSRLDDILDGETRNAIASHDLVELVRNTNREPVKSEEVESEEGTFATISVGRDRIRREILTAAAKRVEDLGIEILDVQFKRITYVDDVRAKVYERMIAERRRIADRFRSEGHGEASKILGLKERELARITSEAQREAEEIRGEADAEATAIYAAAYDRNADTRSFYEFLKTMEALTDVLDENTTILLSTEGEFYRYLKTPAPE